ncbi:MAG: hypothetical protein KF851_08615 [Pirellulaceae bacterium]|nr:hypothetical protein [Pirellulaceae bacterium]
MSNTQIKTVEEFVRFQNSLATYHVIRLGFQLGVLRLLEVGQRTSEQIAEALKLDSWRIELLCSALCETGLLERYEDDFALSPMARLILNDDWDAGFRNAIDQFAVAEEFQTSGKGITEIGRHDWTRTPAAMDAAEALDFGRTRRGLRVLELGGSSAVFSSALAHRDPDCQVTLLDTPENLARSMMTVESIGIAGQFKAVEGNPFDVDLTGENYDLILAAGIFHRLEAAKAKGWIKATVAGLKHEGELAIVDYFHGQEKGARTLAMWELELTLQSAIHKIHSPPVIRTWMLEAGLEHVQFAFLPSVPHVWGLILGQRVA